MTKDVCHNENMPILKKLIFALPFLIFLAWFYYQLNFFFKDIYIIFGLNFSVLIQIIWLIVALGLLSLFFVIFSCLCDDWKFILPVSILGSLISFVIFPIPGGLVIWVGTLLSLIFSYLILNNKLKTYLTFQSNVLLTPSIKTLAGFLILTASLSFYFFAKEEIKTNGFRVPDSLIDTALKFATPQIPDVKGESIAQISLTPEQLELLKQNPDLVRQQGIDPAILDSLPVSNTSQQSSPSGSMQTNSNELVKNLLQSQIKNLVEPYLNLIPVFLAGLFFVTMHSFHSIFSIVYSILVPLIFWILEKTKFIMFEKEQREVKKMVV